MSTQSIDQSVTQAPAWTKIGKRPWLGYTAFAMMLLWSAIAHSVSVLFSGDVIPAVAGMLDADKHFVGGVLGGLMGLCGFYLIWKGFKKTEIEATLLGWMGSNIIWIGWFEETFYISADLMKIPPLTYMDFPYYTGNLLLMQSMLFPILCLLILLGANKDTRCRMFLWFHRHLKLRPEKPTVGYRRQYSRITALESLSIKWVFYLIILMFFDPRVFGPQHFMTYTLLVSMWIWGGYLLFFKLIKIGSAGLAIRYAIPTAATLWLTLEMAALWRWITEIWIHPKEYPISMTIMLIVFIGLFYAVTVTDKEYQKKKAQA